MYLFEIFNISTKSFLTKIRFPVWQTNVYPFFTPTAKVEEKVLPGLLSVCRQRTPGGHRSLFQ
jgi:hypothetical protein